MTWRHAGFRADVAQRWRTGGSATLARPAATLGVELAGATRHGELRRGAQREEGEMGNAVLTKAEDGREVVAGGEVMSGGADRFNGGDGLRWLSGEAEVRTRIAETRRRRQ